MRQAMHQAMHNISKMTLKNMLGDTSYWHWCCVVTLGADVGVGVCAGAVGASIDADADADVDADADAITGGVIGTPHTTTPTTSSQLHTCFINQAGGNNMRGTSVLKTKHNNLK
jgi:hypothetical protein